MNSARVGGIAALGGVALLLAVVVGVASRPGAVDAALGAPPRSAIGYVLDLGVFLLLAASLLMLAAIVVALWPRGRSRDDRVVTRPELPWWMKALMAIVPLGLVAALVVLALTSRGHQAGAPVQPIAPPPPPVAAGTSAGDASAGPIALAAALTVLAIVVVAAVVLVVLSRRRRYAPRAVEERRLRALADALDESLDALRAEPNPRRAVIAAYAALEGSLTRSGVGRRPQEAPFEYMVRALARLPGHRAELQRLATLFEEAKFSRHDIDASMKREAIGALATVRAGLAS